MLNLKGMLVGSEAWELAAQSGRHVGQSERTVGENVDGSGVNDSSLGDMYISAELDQQLGVSQVQISNCKYANFK